MLIYIKISPNAMHCNHINSYILLKFLTINGQARNTSKLCLCDTGHLTLLCLSYSFLNSPTALLVLMRMFHLQQYQIFINKGMKGCYVYSAHFTVLWRTYNFYSKFEGAPVLNTKRTYYLSLNKKMDTTLETKTPHFKYSHAPCHPDSLIFGL